MTKSDTVEVEEKFGATLVRAWDNAGTLHRYWIDETDEGRTAVITEVVVIEETGGRDYIPYREMDVPDRVRDALDDEGFDVDPVYDGRGRVLVE